MSRAEELLQPFMQTVQARAPGEDAFLEAVREVAADVLTVEKAHHDYSAARVLERLTVPDTVVSFAVVWHDDEGRTQVNRGWRVQCSNALGPYKGGLRFHPSLDVSTLKALAFEQTFKNALTGLPLGGAKGGADFDPRGRSPREVERFCHAFMLRLAPFIGANRDVPAGDMNVGSREIGWLFGTYQRLAQRWEGGALTGKPLTYGGSPLREEATGYGLVYFVQRMLSFRKEELCGLRVAVSGKGNVARHAAKKALQLGARVVTLSDTSGTLYVEDGVDDELLAWVAEQKAKGGDLSSAPRGRFLRGEVPWGLPCDVALPCATQHEMDAGAARTLIDAGCKVVAEGANLPLTEDAVKAMRESTVLYAPGKASNGGGVAVSGLEMSQNAQFTSWDREDVDQRLQQIMSGIHERCVDDGHTDGGVDYVRGANRAGYRRVAEAVVAMGDAG